jgi:hypothetical protein
MLCSKFLVLIAAQVSLCVRLTTPHCHTSIPPFPRLRHSPRNPRWEHKTLALIPPVPPRYQCAWRASRLILRYPSRCLNASFTVATLHHLTRGAFDSWKQQVQLQLQPALLSVLTHTRLDTPCCCPTATNAACNVLAAAATSPQLLLPPLLRRISARPVSACIAAAVEVAAAGCVCGFCSHLCCCC